MNEDFFIIIDRDTFMNNLWIFGLALAFYSGAWASDAAPKKINRPYFLRIKDKIPNDSLTAPAGSLEDANGQTLNADVNITPPDAGVMDQLSDPGLFEKIRKTKSVETAVNRFYWHSDGDLDYCHYQDMEGNHWYGWSDDGGFNWVLWRGHRYWWHDPFARHWLYYYQGYWWRADGQTHRQHQQRQRFLGFGSGRGFPHTAYSAAKFAVKGFTEALSTDLKINAPHIKCSTW